jgi:hypothetical protein
MEKLLEAILLVIMPEQLREEAKEPICLISLLTSIAGLPELK